MVTLNSSYSSLKLLTARLRRILTPRTCSSDKSISCTRLRKISLSPRSSVPSISKGFSILQDIYVNPKPLHETALHWPYANIKSHASVTFHISDYLMWSLIFKLCRREISISSHSFEIVFTFLPCHRQKPSQNVTVYVCGSVCFDKSISQRISLKNLSLSVIEFPCYSFPICLLRFLIYPLITYILFVKYLTHSFCN